jgi:hypothetical protein
MQQEGTDVAEEDGVIDEDENEQESSSEVEGIEDLHQPPATSRVPHDLQDQQPSQPLGMPTTLNNDSSTPGGQGDTGPHITLKAAAQKVQQINLQSKCMGSIREVSDDLIDDYHRSFLKTTMLHEQQRQVMFAKKNLSRVPDSRHRHNGGRHGDYNDDDYDDFDDYDEYDDFGNFDTGDEGGGNSSANGSLGMSIVGNQPGSGSASVAGEAFDIRTTSAKFNASTNGSTLQGVNDATFLSSTRGGDGGDDDDNIVTVGRDFADNSGIGKGKGVDRVMATMLEKRQQIMMMAHTQQRKQKKGGSMSASEASVARLFEVRERVKNVHLTKAERRRRRNMEEREQQRQQQNQQEEPGARNSSRSRIGRMARLAAPNARQRKGVVGGVGGVGYDLGSSAEVVACGNNHNKPQEQKQGHGKQKKKETKDWRKMTSAERQQFWQDHQEEQERLEQQQEGAAKPEPAADEGGGTGGGGTGGASAGTSADTFVDKQRRQQRNQRKQQRYGSYEDAAHCTFRPNQGTKATRYNTRMKVLE